MIRLLISIKTITKPGIVICKPKLPFSFNYISFIVPSLICVYKFVYKEKNDKIFFSGH